MSPLTLQNNMSVNQFYKYTIKDLVAAFSQAGLIVSRSWIYRQEEKGNLIIPSSTTDFKKAQGTRKSGATRLLTENSIKSILKAFLPGGTGFYDYHKDKGGEK